MTLPGIDTRSPRPLANTLQIIIIITIIIIIVQEIEIWPYQQMVYAQPKICPAEWDAQTPLEFWDTDWSPYLGQTTRTYNNQQQ